MVGTLLKWLIPGVVTVIGGTALAVSQTGAAVTSDLGARASVALESPAMSWAQVSIDGRDAILTGTTTSQAAIDQAVSAIGAVHGVRTVISNVALASFVSPFPFSATLENGKTTLGGGYPDETIHADLLGAVAGATDTMKLASGAPAQFDAAAKLGLVALADLDQGEIALSDTALSVAGRAKSGHAFDSLQNLAQSLPAGITLASLKITPPLVDPYVWTAVFDGTRLSMSGDVPSPDVTNALRAAAPANVPVSATLTLASGEPAGFSDNALALLRSLLSLESGQASISGTTISLSGAPSTAAIADAATAEVQKLGGTATLQPARVAEFAFAVDKAAGNLTFSGFVPDTATRDKFAAIAGADTTKLQLGRGGPEHFAAAVDFGLGALAHLSDGRFDIKADRLSVGGRAATVADFRALTDMITHGAPQGLTLVAAEIHPPVVSPFTWSATRSAGGRTTLAGFVPDQAARTTLAQKAGGNATDQSDLADGAPLGFALSASKGLDVLALLDTGSLKFDGTNWAIEGTVDSPKKGFAADAAYSVAGLRTAGWTYDVHLPTTAAAGPLPIIAPYVWRAQKAADGSLSFGGFVPADWFKDYLKSRSSTAIDTTVPGAGAPADFAPTASAGLDALLQLDQGSLSLAGDHWTLTGEIADAATRDAIQAALAAKIDATQWQIAIQAKDAAPVVTPYLWSATKSADGSIELSGYVPNDALKTQATAHAGTVGRDTTTIASGEPTGFADDLLAGLDALTHLRDGKAAFDGSKWHLTGDAATPGDGDAAAAALQKGSKGGTLWDSQLAGLAVVSSSEASSEASASAGESSSSIVTPDITSLAPLSEPASSSAVVSASASTASSFSSSEAASTAASSEEASSAAPSASEAPLSSIESSSSSSAPSSSTPPPSSSTSAPASSSQPPQNRDVTATSLQVMPPLPDNLVFEAIAVPGAPVTLKGGVPDTATATLFGTLAGKVPTKALTPHDGLPDDFVASGTAGLAALQELSDGHLAFDGGKWWLQGRAEQQSVKDDIASKVAALPNGGSWSVTIKVMVPLDVCRVRVATLAKRNAIIFQGNKLVASSMPVLDELAKDLNICADTDVHVQGHTDADGDKDVNLALSVSRAETVVSELIKRGVSDSRLYAEGFGESAPIASNDTKDGKAKNRRIAFEIDPE